MRMKTTRASVFWSLESPGIFTGHDPTTDFLRVVTQPMIFTGHDPTDRPGQDIRNSRGLTLVRSGGLTGRVWRRGIEISRAGSGEKRPTTREILWEHEKVSLAEVPCCTIIALLHEYTIARIHSTSLLHYDSIIAVAIHPTQKVTSRKSDRSNGEQTPVPDTYRRLVLSSK